MEFVQLTRARHLQWRRVPAKAAALAEAAADAAGEIREAIRELPQDSYLDIWYSPEEKLAAVDFGPWSSSEDNKATKAAVATVAHVVPIGDIFGEDWLRVAMQPPGILYQKRASSTTLRLAGNLGGFFNDYLGNIPGVPSPLAATLASGTLGAGLGYGTGWVAEKFLPEKWRRNRLRRTLAILGGLGGAGLGAGWGAVNLKEFGLPGLVKGWPLDTPPDTLGPLQNYDAKGNLVKIESDDTPITIKAADFGNAWSDETGAFPPPIDAENLIHTIYAPPVAQQLPPAMQAATTGLVLGAGHHQTGGEYMPRLVSPLAVGRMAAGMGSGWLSGMLVGKVLSALTGMPPEAQDRLKSTGLWAGAIANMVPLAFPGR